MTVRLAKLTSCTCPGYIVTYECTVMGGLGTVWRGSAFNCEISANEIVLLHSRFGLSDRDYTKTCNNGAISGYGVTVSNGFYTSQVNVTISRELIGKTIECAHFGGSLQAVGSLTITATTCMVHSQCMQCFMCMIMISYYLL